MGFKILISFTFCLAADWWVLYGTSAPNLRKIAIRVLSQTCSASGCERNWSTFSLIHNKRRNRLGSKRLEHLVYVHYNMRLRLKHIQEEMEDPSAQEPIELANIFQQNDDEEEDVLYQWVRDRGAPEMDQPGGMPDPTIASAMDPTEVEAHMSSEEGAVHTQPAVPFEESPGRPADDDDSTPESSSGDDDATASPSHITRSDGGDGDDITLIQMMASSRSGGQGSRAESQRGKEPIRFTGETQFTHATQDQDHGAPSDMSMHDLVESMGSMSIDTGSSHHYQPLQPLQPLQPVQPWHTSHGHYDYGYNDPGTGSDYSAHRYGAHHLPYGYGGGTTHTSGSEYESNMVPSEYGETEGGLLSDYFRNPYGQSPSLQEPNIHSSDVEFTMQTIEGYPRLLFLQYADDNTYLNHISIYDKYYSTMTTWETFIIQTQNQMLRNAE